MPIDYADMCSEISQRRLDGRLKGNTYRQGKRERTPELYHENYNRRLKTYKRSDKKSTDEKKIDQKEVCYPFRELKVGEYFLIPIKLNTLHRRVPLEINLRRTLKSMIIESEFRFQERSQGIEVIRIK